MKKITRKKLYKSKKEDIFISVEQIKEMFKEIQKDTRGFIVWIK